ncbi:MAG: methyltransferase domain-containing protein [Gammaproteobacteria bacterium]|nr:methyltransferase domain-containing protein [Gammaproteobacteria bacterium]
MEWFHRPAAHLLMQEELDILKRHLPTLFGYHRVQLGDLFAEEAYAESPIKHSLRLSLPESRDPGDVATLAEALPLKNESIDLIVMPHVLEFSRQPHNILREVDRSLIPDGHVLIYGFNPWSHLQLQRWLQRWFQHVPWRGRYLSRYRLQDWLTLLGFEVLDTACFQYRPLLVNDALSQRLAFMERGGQRLLPWMGAAYYILARKRVEAMTPLRMPRRAKRVIGIGLSES